MIMNKFLNKSLGRAIAPLLIGAMFSGCAPLGQPHYHMPEVKGRVVDLETSKPVKDALALAVYEGSTGLGHVDVDAQEASTDSGGEFLIPDTKVFNKGDYGRLGLSHLYILAPGYFPAKTRTVSVQPVTLQKMTHYLHYRKLPEFALDVPEQNVKTSTGYQGWLHAVTSPWLTKTSATGVFLQDPQRQFSKVFWQGDYYDEDRAMGGSFIWAYDAKNQQWLALDCAGKTAPAARFVMKDWNSMSSSQAEPAIFAGKDGIFILPDRNMQKTEGDNKLVRLTPAHGDISAITGDWKRFYTIEGGGIYFCAYELKPGENAAGDAYAKKVISRGEISIFSDETSALPTLEAVSTIRLHDAPYIILLTKSAVDSRIHLCRKEKDEYYFEPIMLFPPEQEISAIASSGADDTIYIAFKNGGIRKYSAIEKSAHLGDIFVEDETFAAHAKYVSFPEIVSMTVGADDLTGSVLYAAAKNGIIYRVAADGTPDYRVKFEGSLP
ncbi:MAG: hypothetical protein C4531_04250 [Desulfurivibrio sp.]|nr:MAG: hypothetical protein C4531_04250 [Desulfurivibrio sp.]